MEALPHTARWYLFTVWALALVWILAVLATPPPLAVVPIMVLALIAFVLSDLFAVRLSLQDGDGVSMTVTDTVQVFLAGTVGFAGVLVPFLGSLISDTVERRAWYKGLFNAAQRALIYLVITWLYALVMPPGARPFAGWQGLAAVVVIVVVYLALNALLVSGVVALTSGNSLLAVYVGSLGQTHWVHLFTLPLGAVLATVADLNPWMLLPALVPLVMAYRSFRAMASLRDESRKSKALAEKLERLQDTTTAMLASDEPLPLLELVSERLAALLDAPAAWVILDEGEPRLVAVRGVSNPASIDLEASLAELRRMSVGQRADEGALDGGRSPAVLHIPMVTGGRLIGGFCLALPAPMSLADDDRRVLLAFAAQTALAVERTRLSEQLRTKQDELLRTAKLAAMGTLAAGIAHEFNNLLTAIGGFAQLGLVSNDVSEKDEALQVALRTSQRGQSITAGLLTFARRRDARRELCQIRDVADETLVLVERQLVRKSIVVVREYETAPQTFCDPGQIAQVVMNLITNARDAMTPAGGTLILGVRADDGQVELRVSDTGVGIPADMLTEIFQPFVTTKTASETSGTGLGLAITRDIVTDHGGTIEVVSAVGKGTTVLVRLPVITAEEEYARLFEGTQREVSA